MNIAIDVSPLESGHKVRGVGFYLKHLQSALVEYFPDNKYTFFTKKEEIPQEIDIIHYPYFDPFFLTLPIKKQAKTVVTVHDLTPLVFPEAFPAGLKGKLRWQIQKQALKHIDQIITDSEASKKDIIHLAGVRKDKVHVVYLAAGEEFKQLEIRNLKLEMEKKFDLPDKFLLYVGDVTWNKNLPRLLEAMADTNVPLVMVGKALAEQEFDRTNPWNADRMKVHNLAQKNKNIHLLGFVSDEDLVRLYNSATAFILPSLYEGFGLPILEAMSCGTPVITTKCGSLPEVAGEAAYFVDAKDVISIADGVRKLFGNKEIRDELSQKGLTQAKKFSWKKTAEETIQVYKKAIGS